MLFISLGGAGGCGIAQDLKKINTQATYPFDWTLCKQSFVLNCFTNILIGSNPITTTVLREHFIDFGKEEYYYRTATNIYVENKNRNVISLHDFGNGFPYNSINILSMEGTYIRRLNRLRNVLESTDPIVFIRRMNHSFIGFGKKSPEHGSEEPNFDDYMLWFEFREQISKQYNKEIYIVLLIYNNDIFNIIKQYQTKYIRIKFEGHPQSTIQDIYSEMINL